MSVFRRSRNGSQRIASSPLDRRGYYRSPVTTSAFREGQAPPNKGMKLPAEPLSHREVLALIDACGRGPCGRRDAGLIVVMWRAGLRVAEALALEPKDVDLVKGRIRVLHGKGDRARTVGLDKMACAVIDDWLGERRRLGIPRTWDGLPTRLFCVVSKPTTGAPLHYGCVRDKLKRLAVKADIQTRVHPHGLRHTHAFELIEEGVPVHYIRRQLGHASLAVTARYVEHLNPADVIDRIRAREWPELGEDQTPHGGAPRS